jgi:hypothetical protein
MEQTQQSDELMRGIAAQHLTEVFCHYQRTDVDSTTPEGRMKALATLAIQDAAINTLGDQPVWCPDGPISKTEAARLLKLLLLKVPNSLGVRQIEVALNLVRFLSKQVRTTSETNGQRARIIN